MNWLLWDCWIFGTIIHHLMVKFWFTLDVYWLQLMIFLVSILCWCILLLALPYILVCCNNLLFSYVYYSMSWRKLSLCADGVCAQSIEHPGCVWDVKFLENGDLVTACSDGVVRIWTTHADRMADPMERESYTSQLSSYKISRYYEPLFENIMSFKDTAVACCIFPIDVRCLWLLWNMDARIFWMNPGNCSVYMRMTALGQLY